MYWLFAAHHWPLTELRALWEAGAGWHDLILALASFEAEHRPKAGKSGAKRVKITQTRRR